MIRLLRNPRFWAAAILIGLTLAGVALASPHLWAWYHLRAARAELQKYHNPQAIRHLQVCLRIWHDDPPPDVLLLAARSARRARSYTEAEDLLRKYQQKQGLDNALELEQLLLSAECRVDQVASACIHRVDEGQPETPLILEALIRGYLRQYLLPEARTTLDRWLQMEPDNPQPWCLDGLYQLDYARVGSAAETSYRRAVELDAEHEEARLGYSVALLHRKKFAEALPNLEILHRCQPENLSVQVGLGECYDGQGQDERAWKIVDSILAQQPLFAPALALRGRLALKSGKAQEAAADLRQAVTINPIDYRSRYNLFLSLQRLGKDDEANKIQKQLQQADEDQTRYNEIVTKDIVQRPNDPALHCELGQILLRGGQMAEGTRWLQSSLRLDPQYAPARQALAQMQSSTKPDKP